MENDNFKCIELPWDSDYFGLKSARVNLSGPVNKNEQNEILEFCCGFDFVTIFNKDNIVENNLWIGKETNSFLVDMNLQFTKKLNHELYPTTEETYVIKGMLKNNQIIEIASKSFSYSRFFNDPYLPVEKARNIYSHWIETSFSNEDKYFVVSEDENNPLGFILFSIIEEIGVIELIAVNQENQGKKVGKKLIKALEIFLSRKGINTIKVGTQINNIIAIQFYTKMGFRLLSSSSIYHLWKK